MKPKERFIARAADNNDLEAVKAGLGWLHQRAVTEGSGQAILATYSRQQFNSESLAAALGERRARALQEGKAVEFGRVTLLRWTNAAPRRPTLLKPTPVLCVYVGDRQLNMIDAVDNVSAICLVEYPSSYKEWIDTWSPIDVVTNAPVAASQASTPSSIVQQALRSISGVINPRTGPTGHPSDRDASVGAFSRLNKAGVAFDVGEVRRFLIAKLGWSPEHADRLCEIAEGTKQGRRFRVGRHWWADDIVEQWKRRAEEEGDEE